MPHSVGSLDDAGSCAHRSLIDELDTVVGQRNIGSRADILRQVTDLFVIGCDHYDAEQRALFDDVMGHLIAEIEVSARAEFGERIAKTVNAPTKVSRALALDDSIEVAAPLLTHSDQLDEETLIVGAKTKSQAHMLAISQRKSLSEGITDVLVERGDQKVVVSTARNAGARFSNFGYSKLVARSETDDELALTVWSRPGIPHEHLLTLFAIASEAVQTKLASADRWKAAMIRDTVKQAADQIQTNAREGSADFAAAQIKICTLHKAGTLTEDRLREFAEAVRFDEILVALSLLGDLPIGAVERAMVHDNSDQVLLLAKAVGFSWDTTKAILTLQAAIKNWSNHYLDHYFSSFDNLKVETARTAIQFCRLRQRATNNKQTTEPAAAKVCSGGGRCDLSRWPRPCSPLRTP